MERKKRFQLKYAIYFFGFMCVLSGLFYIATRYIVDINIGSLIETRVISSPAAVQLLALEQKFLVHNLLQIFIVLSLGMTVTFLVAAKKLAAPLFSIQSRIKELTEGKRGSKPVEIKDQSETAGILIDFERYARQVSDQLDYDEKIFRDVYHQLVFASEKLRKVGSERVSELDEIIERMEAQIETLEKPKERKAA